MGVLFDRITLRKIINKCIYRQYIYIYNNAPVLNKQLSNFSSSKQWDFMGPRTIRLKVGKLVVRQKGSKKKHVLRTRVGHGRIARIGSDRDPSRIHRQQKRINGRRPTCDWSVRGLIKDKFSSSDPHP